MDNEITNTKETESEENISPKSRLCALLLGIFLSYFGVHNFYLGRIVRGLLQLIIMLGSYLTFIISTIVNPSGLMKEKILITILIMDSVMIWGVVEWIVIAAGKAKDGKGRKVLLWTID